MKIEEYKKLGKKIKAMPPGKMLEKAKALTKEKMAKLPPKVKVAIKGLI